MNRQRETDRVRTSIVCSWGLTEVCPRNGRITSLSARGCFIKTKAEVREGQSVFVNCWLPSEHWMPLRGQVRYCLPRIGFGLVFDSLTDKQGGMIELLMDYYRENAA